MPGESSANNDFRMLEEYVCTAIPEPGLFPPGTTFSRGENGGMTILPEFVSDAINLSDHDSDPAS